MPYVFTASGSVRVGGCAGYAEAHYYRYAYAVGSIVYFRQKAAKGVFERVVVKEVRFPKNYDPTRTRLGRHGNLSPLYVDTFNGLFNEEDLISYDDAAELVAAYNARVREEAENNALNCT